jgi:multiple sugar transport system permease protein
MTSKKKKNFTPYLFILPGFIFLAFWIIFPMIKAFQISLYDWNIMPNGTSEFLGVQNYLRAFKDDLFWLAVKNSLLYALVTVVGQLAFGLLLAVVIDRISYGQVFFRTLYYLPVVTSWVVCSLLFKFLFNSSPAGLVNYVLVNGLHLIKEPVTWLNEPGTAFISLYALGIWKGVGWTMVIFLAAIQAIPEELRQAALVDGANEWQYAWKITIPLLIPTIVLTSIMLTIGAFQTYIPIALITNGGPIHRTEVILSYMYEQAFTNRDFGYGSALSYILIVIVFAISQIQMRLRKEENQLY